MAADRAGDGGRRLTSKSRDPLVSLPLGRDREVTEAEIDVPPFQAEEPARQPREGGVVKGGAQGQGRALARLARHSQYLPRDPLAAGQADDAAGQDLAGERDGVRVVVVATRSSSGWIGPGTSRPVVQSTRAT